MLIEQLHCYISMKYNAILSNIQSEIHLSCLLWLDLNPYT